MTNPTPAPWMQTNRIGQNRALQGSFLVGAAFPAAGVGITQIIPLGRALRWRIRCKFSKAGTLSAQYVGADGVTVFGANNPADVAVAADTETKMEEATHMGEAGLKLTFISTAAVGTVTYVWLSTSA